MSRLFHTTLALLIVATALPIAIAPRAAAQADTVRGETLFKQRCAMCHSLKGKGGKLGPDLTAVVGRKAGAGSFAYSPAMKASKIVWKPASLDTFLAAPMKMIPGSRMAIAVSKPEERKALIGYLAAAK